VPDVIDRHRLRGLIDEHLAQSVEVLPTDEYDEEHLPGAVNLPLKQLNAEVAARALDAPGPWSSIAGTGSET
jgi:rhodanese-related sulfurtransferase